MSELAIFYAYARAFEVAVLSDDWSLLLPFFTPDAEHRVVGPAPFACDDRGRDAVAFDAIAGNDGVVGSRSGAPLRLGGEMTVVATLRRPRESGT